MKIWLLKARISPEAVGLPLENQAISVGLNANEMIFVALKLLQTLICSFDFSNFTQKLAMSQM